MRQLVAYLIEHMFLDFDGDLSLDQVRNFLREDDTRESRQLLGKLVEDRGVDELMTTLADCLKESLRTGIGEETVREQIRLYAES